MIGFFIRLGIRVGVFASLVVGFFTALAYHQLPSPQELFSESGRGHLTLLDKDGKLIGGHGSQYGGILRARDASPNLIKAIFAIEDRRFMSHIGIDPMGLMRAIVANARSGSVVQGGSTLTQQAAKNVFLNNERSTARKLKELPYALAMELKYTKDEILSIYINRVYMGAGAYGFETGAYRYFGKSARDLSLSEAAMLAGLLKAPSRLSPTSNKEAANQRAAVVLDAMVDAGYITQAEAQQAKKSPAKLNPQAISQTGQYYMDWAVSQVPEWLVESEDSSAFVRTTFDPKIQQAAEDAVEAVFKNKVKEGSKAQVAVVVMSPDGAVRAMVGGRSFRSSPFNRAVSALRQPGSSFKPVVYAAAMEAGMTPLSRFDNAPLVIGNWSPKNYDDVYGGQPTMADALARSINVVAVRAAESAGRKNVREMARRLGIQGELTEGPSIALGVSEVNLLDMTSAYAVFANRGKAARPYGVTSVVIKGDRKPVMTYSPESDRILDEKYAGWMTSMLAEVTGWGTGKRALMDGHAVAGKTGTTQNARDAWFIGYTGNYVAGVWMGFDDNTPLQNVSGGGLPTEIWRETMKRAHAGVSPKPLPAVPYQGMGGNLVSSTAGSIIDAGAGVFNQLLNDVRTLFGGSESGGRNQGGGAPVTNGTPSRSWTEQKTEYGR